MKSLITTLLTIGLLVPAGATYAFSIEELIEAAKAGSGIYVESQSSVSTGGQTVKSGETVSTGDVSASSHTETRINATNEGGTVEVKIETSKNGVTEKKEYAAPIKSGEGVSVEAKASVTDTESESSIKVNNQTVGATSSESAHISQTASAAQQSKISLLFSTHIPNFFKKAFSWFWGI